MYAERTRLTYDDYALIPDDGKRHEIVDGEEYVSPSPETRHQRLVMRLAETLSDVTRRHDMIRKRHLYERAGVTAYWVVDPEIDQVQVFRLEGRGYARIPELTAEAGENLASELLPGFELTLDELFA